MLRPVRAGESAPAVASCSPRMKRVACLIFLGVCGHVAWGQCDTEGLDLCDSGDVKAVSNAKDLAPAVQPLALTLALVLSGREKCPFWAVALLPLATMLPAASAASPAAAPA